MLGDCAGQDHFAVHDGTKDHVALENAQAVNHMALDG